MMISSNGHADTAADFGLSEFGAIDPGQTVRTWPTAA
jgi:hypothetical protein